jgi:peptidoglycan/LPS O-acetylase OafA/YrhL
VAEQGKRVRPFLGWTSLGLSLASPFIAAVIIATGPHANFVAAYAGLLLCGIISALGVLAGIIGIRRKEQPRHSALAGITVGVSIILLCLLFSSGCQIESGF